MTLICLDLLKAYFTQLPESRLDHVFLETLRDQFPDAIFNAHQDFFVRLEEVRCEAGYQVLEQSSSLSPRDRLFDCFMARLDCLEDMRTGFSWLLKHAFQPRLLWTLAPTVAGLYNTKHVFFVKTLTELGFDTPNTFQMQCRVHALILADMMVLSIWAEDTTSDLSPTMAGLERVLEKLKDNYQQVFLSL